MKKVCILLAEGFEEIEMIVVADLLKRSGVNVIFYSLNSIEVSGSHGIKVVSDNLLSDVNDELLDCDCVFLPGGMPGAKNLFENAHVKTILIERFSKGRMIAAICAAPALVLHPLGILKNKKFTCYPGMEKGLTDCFYEKRKVVKDGCVLTSMGPATAFDLGFQLVEILCNKETSDTLKNSTLSAL